MKFSSGEFHQGWDNVTGWGRAVTVRSRADLPMVRRFIEDSGDFRRAVMLENVTAAERRNLVSAIEALGVELREFTTSDMEQLENCANTFKKTMVMSGVLVLSLPYLIVLRMQGRKSTMFSLTPASNAPGYVSDRPCD